MQYVYHGLNGKNHANQKNLTIHEKFEILILFEAADE